MKIPETLRQPSTWAGVGVLLTAIGIPASASDAIVVGLAGVAGLLAVFLGERKPPSE